MEQLMMILNSPFGLLITGALISGLFVQYITSRWQQRSWIFQQSFIAERAKFEKELEQRYKALENINHAITEILTFSQLVVVGHMKKIQAPQKDEQMRKYNEAVIAWETDFSIWGIRLQTFFSDRELPALWNAIKKERDDLDIAIYMLTARNEGTPADSLKLIEQISSMTIALSQRMLEEINNMDQRGLV
jgi:hypothetical protein